MSLLDSHEIQDSTLSSIREIQENCTKLNNHLNKLYAKISPINYTKEQISTISKSAFINCVKSGQLSNIGLGSFFDDQELLIETWLEMFHLLKMSDKELQNESRKNNLEKIVDHHNALIDYLNSINKTFLYKQSILPNNINIGNLHSDIKSKLAYINMYKFSETIYEVNINFSDIISDPYS